MEECVKQLCLGFKLNNFILIKNRFKVEVKNCKSIQLKDEDPDPLDSGIIVRSGSVILTNSTFEKWV